MNPSASYTYLCKRKDVPIRDRDGHGDTSVCKCTDNVLVDVKDFDAVDGCLSFDEVGNLGRWREVVGCGPVVYTDGCGSGGKVEEGGGKEEEVTETETGGGHGLWRW